ncbi:MAG: hypothetical protein Q4G33_10165 [bacterium]|nr:hypothetical protein [bacterium]MDO5398283.1 hypothetical protein [bacterium]
MITSEISFLDKSLTVDLSCPPIKLHRELQDMGVLTPQDLIRLDNMRTLKIHLYPNDSRGEQIIDLVSTKSDTLGELNQLCYSIKCMDRRDSDRFFENLDCGKYKTLAQAQHDTDVMRGQRRIKNKKNKFER